MVIPVLDHFGAPMKKVYRGLLRCRLGTVGIITDKALSEGLRKVSTSCRILQYPYVRIYVRYAALSYQLVRGFPPPFTLACVTNFNAHETSLSSFQCTRRSYNDCYLKRSYTKPAFMCDKCEEVRGVNSRSLGLQHIALIMH